MPSQEDWLALKNEAVINRSIKEDEQQKLRHMVSQAMEELRLTDPRWKLYAEHISREIAHYKAKQRLVIQDLTNHNVFRSSEAYGQLCLENAGTARYIEALEWCLDFIDKLINEGKQGGNHE